jgi:crotonobetainyl-CoA:carnitine CoA-transferase CaiB-like acyl-CoA transferase
MMLADMGADVLRAEAPDRVDLVRITALIPEFRVFW